MAASRGLAEGDFGRVVVDVGAGRTAVPCLWFGVDGTSQFFVDVRQVEAGVHDGGEVRIGCVRVLMEVGVEIDLEVATPEILVSAS